MNETIYPNSAAYHAVMSATTSAQLETRKRYTLMAIEYHQERGDKTQATFFLADLELIEKRLKTIGH